MGQPNVSNETVPAESRGNIKKDEYAHTDYLSKKGKTIDHLPHFIQQDKIDGKRNGVISSDLMALSSEKEMQAKAKAQPVKSCQTQSGPHTPNVVLSHYSSDKGLSSERGDSEIQPFFEKTKCEGRRAPSFNGPQMLPNRASANSLSAPIKSSGGFRDSLDEKSKANLVQIKGRFSVMSENMDLAKDISLGSVPRRSSQGSPLRKSASVGDWIFEARQPNQPSKEPNSSCFPATLLLPHLQNLFQQTSIQQELIMSLLSCLQAADVDGSQNGKLPPLPCGSDNNGNAESAVAQRERLLLLKISELQARMSNLTEELTTEKSRYMQLQQQLNAMTSQSQDGDQREGDS